MQDAPGRALDKGDRNGEPRGYRLKKYGVGRVKTPQGYVWLGVRGTDV
jgi:hypothetical protein